MVRELFQLLMLAIVFGIILTACESQPETPAPKECPPLTPFIPNLY